jgi:hypothetical protein
MDDWGRRPCALGAPAGFDFSYVRYYMIRMLRTDKPFGFSCIDMKSVASTLLKKEYYASGKRGYNKQWARDKFPHTHIAVDDAREQAWLFARMLDEYDNFCMYAGV